MKQNITKVARGDRVLKRMESNHMLTPDGVAFLKAALDPFHDEPISGHRGWPDLETSPSIVRCIKRSVNITKPGGLAAGNWDAHVLMWPWLNPVDFVRGDRDNNVVLAIDAAAPVTHGAIEVLCASAGSGWTMANSATYSVAPSNIYTKGVTRLCGIAYEVTDNTADIYKQGHSYHYRQSNSSSFPSSWIVDPGSVSGDPPVIATLFTTATLSPYRPMLPSADQIMNQPDTVDWPAKHGCYCVGSFCNTNPPQQVGYTGPVIIEAYLADVSKTDDVEGFGNDSKVWVPEVRTQAPTLATYASMPGIKLHPINQSGSLFTGLNEFASLTVTAHYFIESFPSVAESDILVLASPSASYDPLALEMLSRATQELPVAVMVSENPDGEWWSDVIDSATDVLAPMAAAFGFPEVTPLIYGGGKMLSRAVRPPPQPKKPSLVQQRPAQQKRQNGKKGK